MKRTFALVSLLIMAVAGCTTPGEKTAIGAGAGAAAGAGLGAIIGNQSGEAGKGALIGAAAGALIGGAIGNRLDKQAKELAAIAETKRTDEGILTKLKGDILFDTGSAALKSEAVSNVHKMAEIIKKYPQDRITIVGHTDNTGNASTNKTLSEERAQAVKVEMTSVGVPSDAVTAVGMGPSQPVASNKTASGRSQNRRVELHISMTEAASR